MLTFKLKKKEDIVAAYQARNYSEFTFDGSENENDNQIADAFIHSNHFDDSLRAPVHALRSNHVSLHHFKKFNKSDVALFLVNFMNSDDWGEDRDEFKSLLDKYFEIQSSFTDAEFYVINKDWFTKDDSVISDPAIWIYLYYFIIFWIDSPTQTLGLTEWVYD